MRLTKYLLSFIMTMAFSTTTVFADTARQDGSRFEEELNEQDFDALRNFINSKRNTSLEEKSTKMVIAGDVRTEWRHMTEKGRYSTIFGEQRNLRGGRAINYKSYPVSKNDFDMEFNLYFKYKTDRTWVVAQLQFDNSAGVFDNGKECRGQGPNTAQGQLSIDSDGRLDPDPVGWHGSGTCDDICLKKAYMGYNLYTCGDDDTRVFVELGRRRLNNVFDSNIQFLSQFDGILLSFNQKYENVSDWYINIGGLVVNEKVNHFAYVIETGLMNINDSGVDLKYSLIDWTKHGRAQCFFTEANGHRHWNRDPRGFKFINSQFTAYYNFDQEVFCRPANIFGAFLINHAQPSGKYSDDYFVNSVGERVLIESRTHDNVGWYVGFEIGEVKKEGDWSFEAQYQYVGPTAVPDGDVRGIGRGNTLNESYTNIQRGNANFKGYRFELLYALTDNITVDSMIEWSKAAQNKVGGAHHFSKFKLEAIYAF